MFISEIDNYIDGIINNFYIFIEKKKFIFELRKDENFVKYQNKIINIIKDFISNINNKELKSIVTNENHINYIYDIIKRYCAFYIYLSIAFHYKAGRDLFITNIIETSKNQKESDFQIPNFFNSENNSKIINIYSIIKNIIELKEFKSIDRIKIILSNNPIKYNTTIDLFNNLGEDFIEKYFLIKDNFHNIIKTFIFQIIYLQEEKIEISKILNEEESENAEYKYIDIIVSKDKKLIDFTILQNFLSLGEIKQGLAEEYYAFIDDYKKTNELNILSTKKIINFLFSNKVLIPITEDFLRYHKNTYKYDKNVEDLKSRDSTKIKFIINILNKIKNYHSKTYNTNPKLKVAAKELFFKQIKHRDAILYNADEEISIVNKLGISQSSTDIDYLVDLENARKYCYINYKDLSKDGFRLRTNDTIQGIRYSSIINNYPNDNLELRVGSNDLPLNVVGVIFNPSNKPLDIFNQSDLRDIHKINENGYDGFIKILNEKFDSNENNLYYWLFDNKKDIIKLDQYKNVSSLDNSKYIENMLSEIYPVYMKLLYNKILQEIRENKADIFMIERMLKNYNDQLRTSNIGIDFSKNIMNKIIDLIYKEIKIDINKIDKTLDELQKKNIKIPLSQKIKEKSDIIVVKDKDEDINLEELIDIPICHHYIKWDNLSRISRKKDEDLNQAVFNFVKQYVKVNDIGLYICKSCSETLNLKKYVYEGTYVPELDTFLTTNLAANQKLENIPKYNKYTRTIRNLEKNIEKICGLLNLNYYIGNTPIIKLRRKTIIKDVIDLVLIHTKYLKSQPKDRILKASETYGVSKNLTNLFFFDLKDDIFLTSSADTDYYKIIKFNNVIAYIVFIIITEINLGQIISFKDDKKCNYFIYSKVGKNIFDSLYLRLNETDRIPISKIPLLGYVLFYFSCMLCNNYVWLWDYNNKENNVYNVQKIFINTMVDMMNTIIEANFRKEKDYLYELIVNRFLQKIKIVFNDKITLDKIEKLNNNRIKIVDGKINFITKKEKIMLISDQFKKDDFNYKNYIEYCQSKVNKFKIKNFEYIEEEYNILTNCEDGKFHKFSYNKKYNDLYCNLCEKTYTELNKNLDSKYDSEKKIKLLKLIYLKKLGEVYCKTGDIHERGEDDKCIKCKIDLSDRKYTNNDLYELEKNVNKQSNNQYLNTLDKIKKFFKKKTELKDDIEKIKNKMNDRYQKYTKNNLENYIDDFIEKINNIVGDKIDVSNKTLFLNKTIYKIYNDYLGNNLKKEIILYGNKNVRFIFDKVLNKDIISIRDNTNNVLMIYDLLTKRYLGYKKYDKFIKIKSTNNINIQYSIRDMILNLGLTGSNYNIYYLNSNYRNLTKDEIFKDTDNIIEKIIRNRVANLKYIINNTNNIIEKIRNNFKYDKSVELNKEIALVSKYQKKIDKMNVFNNENSKRVFKHLNIINNNLTEDMDYKNIKLNITNNYVNIDFLKDLNNLDSKLLFYLIFNFERLFQYNNNNINITLFIISLIEYSFNHFFVPLENFQLRRFDTIIMNEAPYVDESLRIIGYYQELVDINNIDNDKLNEQELEAQEEVNSQEIDGYDEDQSFEDFDPNDEITSNLME
jgi:hypothetical protein